jgi:membrane protein implicated in regulation of membrane protease activity
MMGGLSLFWIWLVAGMALFAAETVAAGNVVFL